MTARRLARRGLAAVAAWCALSQALAQQGALPGRLLRDCAECPELVAVPAGRFDMGSAPGEGGREADEGPRHAVRVGGFLMGRTEVTVAQFTRFVEATGYLTQAERNIDGLGCFAWDGSDGQWAWRAGRSWREPGWPIAPDQPVVCVSWQDAQHYLYWLRRITGKDYALPSEAQWEYAARAGSTASRPWGDDPGQACGHANVADRSASADGRSRHAVPHACSDGHWFAAPVASLRPNAFGLHDMLGNVWEWTADCWNPDYHGAPTRARAWSEGDCARRVLRGGGWLSTPFQARAANRVRGLAAARQNDIGFRVARVAGVGPR